MKVVIACVSLGVGGTERVVCSLANFLARDFKVSILVQAVEPDFYGLASDIKVFAPMRKPSLRLFRVFRQLWHSLTVLRKARPKACLIFGEDIGGVLCLIAKLASVQKVYVFNRGTPRRSLVGLNGLLNPIAYRLADVVFVQTNQAKVLIERRYQGVNLRVLPNQVDIPTDVSAVLDRPKVITYVASLGRKKNQAALLRIFSKLRHSEGWELHLAGKGPDQRQLETLAEELGIDSKVKFLGQVKDIKSLLLRTQVFAFPSLEEGFPNSLAEALAHGCACVSYDCPTGPSELIRCGESGILIELGNEHSFQLALDNLLSHPDLRKRLADGARRNLSNCRPELFNHSIATLLLDN